MHIPCTVTYYIAHFTKMHQTRSDGSSVVLWFGKHVGKNLAEIIECDRGYVIWLANDFKNKEIADVCRRMLAESYVSSGGSVTDIVRHIMDNHVIPHYVPPIKQVDVEIPKIVRPKCIDPKLFGWFIDYLVRYALDYERSSCFRDERASGYLSRQGTKACPPGSCMNDMRLAYDVAKSTERASVAEIFLVSLFASTDIDTTQPTMSTSVGEFYQTLKEHAVEQRYTRFAKDAALAVFRLSSDGTQSEIRHGFNLSFAAVGASADVQINETVLDVKWRGKDDLDHYRLQLYAYASLINIRGEFRVNVGIIHNYQLGTCYRMDITDEHARDFVKFLARDNQWHLSEVDRISPASHQEPQHADDPCSFLLKIGLWSVLAVKFNIACPKPCPERKKWSILSSGAFLFQKIFKEQKITDYTVRRFIQSCENRQK